VRSNRFFDETLARVVPVDPNRTPTDPPQLRYDGDKPVPSSPANIRGSVEKIYYLLFSILAPALESVEKKYVQMTSLTDQARLACALERFRIARGAYPATLAELSPDFIAPAPLDIVNGAPYHYRRTESGGFVLYSVGANRVDDGGHLKPDVRAYDQLDWVWTYPAE
jgi:hypothetical protein